MANFLKNKKAFLKTLVAQNVIPCDCVFFNKIDNTIVFKDVETGNICEIDGEDFETAGIYEINDCDNSNETAANKIKSLYNTVADKVKGTGNAAIGIVKKAETATVEKIASVGNATAVTVRKVGNTTADKVKSFGDNLSTKIRSSSNATADNIEKIVVKLKCTRLNRDELKKLQYQKHLASALKCVCKQANCVTFDSLEDDTSYEIEANFINDDIEVGQVYEIYE